ncbi:hypothetical protein [Sinomicrobium sp. M5D2P9]
MKQEESQIIETIKAFTSKADALEIKAFQNRDYQENGFTEGFNALFNQYCYEKQNRTVSGLNFRQPPRYSNLKYCIETEIEPLSKTRYQVIFWGEPMFRSLRFIVDKKQGEWRLIRYKTFLTASNDRRRTWRKHKL